MANYPKEFLEATIRTWQPYSSVSLSLEHARDITENMTRLFLLLSKWEQRSNEDEKKN